ncbi:MAG: hypothetical protein ACI39F_01155 [Acutalibacteraceae bacterium]
MIDIKKVKKIIKERKKIYVNDDVRTREKWNELLDALGNDEEELYNFLKSIDDDTLSWINEIYEEIVEKFPSDRINDEFKRVL